MFPQSFIIRISSQKYIDPEALLKALEEPSPVSIRINSSKWNHIPSGASPVPWSSNGYYLDSRPSYTLDPLFHAGCYYPQEASGMFIEQVIKQSVIASEGLRVLDLCGAPGGKSILLSDLIGKSSLLVANDVIKSRASILAETLTKWGSGNTIVTQNDPSSFGRLKGFFDVILVDAPCSGEGMFRTDIARNEWTEANTAHCSERQKRILMDIWPSLKENGILIFSTCTFNPGENEENIKWLTGKQKAESLKLDISRFEGITEIDYDGISGYGFYPDKIKGEGFFISVIRKNDKQDVMKSGSRRGTDLKPSGKEAESIKNWTSIPGDRLLKWTDDIWGLPCSIDEYALLFQNLRIVKAGTRICTIKRNDFLPVHELALSDMINNETFPAAEIKYEDAVAFLRRDNLRLNIASAGWNILKYQGVNMGWINNLGNRVNNYYPVEWRIRMGLPAAGESHLIKWE
jgi:16S rRNA C967 or C1407 C5-methylase (RsmB/RsmF family)/NOL1/NOP2/fmu family ribosome biogenesis protein